MPTYVHPTFVREVEAARGTVVFGSGVPAITGEVINHGEDHIALQADDGTLYIIPVSAVVYFRHEGDA